MSDIKKHLDDLQTQMNSPDKANEQASSLNRHQDKCFVLNEVYKQEQMSQTQTQIYSRELVREVMLASKNKTIKHQISKISKDSTLYAKPISRNPNEFRFDSIPPNNPHYSSSSSAKIKEINKGLHTRPGTPSTVISNRYQNVNMNRVSSSKSQSRQPRVAVSGLVTYKFNSVNAERSIGSNRINYEEKMNENLKRSKNAKECSGNRFKKILLKYSCKRYNYYVRKQQTFMSDTQSSTEDYISKIRNQNQNERLIYGQKYKKLNFIKDYMASQNTTYAEGRHIVDQIEKFQPKTKQYQEKRMIMTEANQDLQFQQRRIPIFRKKINIRYLTFVE